jgi:hypothetical protein
MLRTEEFRGHLLVGARQGLALECGAGIMRLDQSRSS